jgi:hypothetical protein
MALSGVELRTAKACSEDWAAMQGGVRSRYCSACEKTVHDVAKMTPRDVERLALRAAMGEEVCARLTRDAAGELVTLEARGGGFAGKAAGVVMAAVVAVGSAAAQGVTNEKPLAMLTGRLVNDDGSAVKGPMAYPFVLLRDESGVNHAGRIAPDGTFSVWAPAGAYDVYTPGYGVLVKNAVLHSGPQSVGDVRPAKDEGVIYTTSGGALAARLNGRYWLRHPVRFVQVLGRRVKASFSN